MLRSAKSRLFVGIAVFAVAASAFLPHATYRISTDAIVTAEILRLATPIDGYVAPVMPASGDRLEAGNPIALVADPNPDTREMRRLEQEIAAAEARRDAVRAMLEEMRSMRERLEDRARRFALASVERLREEIGEAEAELARRVAARERAEAEWRRAERLRGTPAISEADLFARATRSREAIAEEDAARARIRRLNIELAAAEAGLTLRDTYNDVPQSRQHAERLAIEMYSATERLADVEERLAALRRALEEEDARVAALRVFSFTPPQSLVVWNRHAQPGQVARRGEPLLDLISCDDIMVEASFPESAYGGIEPGQTAELIFRGGLRARGRVANVRGADPRYRDVLRAGRLPGEPGLRASVLIAVPEGLAASVSAKGREGDGFCGAGRTVEVRIPASDSLLATLINGLIGLPANLASLLGR